MLRFSILLALAVLSCAVAQPADDAYARAARLVSLREGKAAAAIFGDAMKDRPDSVEGYYQKAVGLSDAYLLDGTFEALGKAQKIDPHHAPTLATKGFFFWVCGDTDIGIKCAENALKAAPNNAFAHYVLARCYDRARFYNPEKSWSEVQLAIQCDEKFAAAYEFRGAIKGNRNGDFDGAIEDVNHAISLEPNHGGFYASRAITYANHLEKAKALADWNRAIELDPKNVDFRINRAWHQINLQNPAAALKDLDAALTLSPRKSQIAWAEEIRGRALRYLKRDSDSLAVLDKVVQKYPDRTLARRERSLTRISLGDAEGALADLDALLPKNFSEADRLKRAWILLMLGRNADAESDAMQVLANLGWNDSGAPYAPLIIAVACSNAGNLAKARPVLEAMRTRLSQWPGPIAAFWLDRLSAEELLALADTPSKQTEARAYIGLRADDENRRKEADENSTWVLTHGDRTMLEYDVIRFRRAKRDIAPKPSPRPTDTAP